MKRIGKKIKIILHEGRKMKIKFATKEMKSIWLIRHAYGEKDHGKIKNYMDAYKGRNHEWELSEPGLKKLLRISAISREQYANFINPPFIFVSPFKQTIQTGLYAAYYINSTLKIEEGLLGKYHGLWDRTKMLEYFSKNLQFFDMEYQSRFPATEDKISSFKWEIDHDCFDRSVAYYFIDMLYKENRDIIIIGHQTELYNIQKWITGDIGYGRTKTAAEKIGFASMFKYVLNPQSLKLELKSYYKVPDLL